jgi:hypothetical protein
VINRERRRVVSKNRIKPNIVRKPSRFSNSGAGVTQVASEFAAVADQSAIGASHGRRQKSDQL